jgi:Cu/Ag efflux protein CusF
MHEPIEVAEAKTERTFTKGAVKKIKVDSGKVTIIHEELTELNMPAMTMVFQADDEIVGQLSEGEAVEFVA